jgi:hypothetical protein
MAIEGTLTQCDYTMAFKLGVVVAVEKRRVDVQAGATQVRNSRPFDGGDTRAAHQATRSRTEIVSRTIPGLTDEHQVGQKSVSPF